MKKNNKTVGIIVNPNSGKDIRRLVSSAFVIPQQYKSNELIKLYEGLSSQGVDKIYLMPDFSDVSKRAREKLTADLEERYGIQYLLHEGKYRFYRDEQRKGTIDVPDRIFDFKDGFWLESLMAK